MGKPFAVTEGRKSQRLYLLFAASGVVFWWGALPMLAARGGSLEHSGFWLASLVKAATWLGFVVLLGRTLRSVDLQKRRARQASLFWAIGLFVVVAPMVLFRDALAGWADSATTHIMSPTFRGLDNPLHQDTRTSHEAWLTAWASGRLVLIEAGFLLALAILLGTLAMTRVAKWRFSGVVGAPARFAESRCRSTQ